MNLQVISLPPTISKSLDEQEVQTRVLLRLLEKVSAIEDLEEIRDDLRFSVTFHKTHKKLNALNSYGCGCEYCHALHKYAYYSLTEHRTRRRIDDRWYGNLHDSEHLLVELRLLEEKKLQARKKKNELKEKLALSKLYN